MSDAAIENVIIDVAEMEHGHIVVLARYGDIYYIYKELGENANASGNSVHQGFVIGHYASVSVAHDIFSSFKRRRPSERFLRLVGKASEWLRRELE